MRVLKSLLACLLMLPLVGQTPTPAPKPKPKTVVRKVKAKKPRTVLPEPILEYMDIVRDLHSKEEILELCKTKSPYYMYRLLSNDMDIMEHGLSGLTPPWWWFDFRRSLEDWGRNLTVE